MFIKKEILTQVFTCEFCEISENKFFTEKLRMTAFTQTHFIDWNWSLHWKKSSKESIFLVCLGPLKVNYRYLHMFLHDSHNFLEYFASNFHIYIVPYFQLFVFIPHSFSCFDLHDILQFIMVNSISLQTAFDFIKIFHLKLQVCKFIKNETLAQVLSCKFSKIS